MTPPPATFPDVLDPEQAIVPDSLSSHLPDKSTSEEKSQDPFFVYQRELARGTKLDHYEIESVLGGGGFGITYLARDILLNRLVVIKENFPSAYSHRDPLSGRIVPNNIHELESYNWALRSFLNEARTIAELDHPGIAKILSIFESNGTAYFAMEFIDGFSLEYLGDQLFLSKKHYTEDELKGLLYRLLNILSYVHQQGIYHRDIKPGNILLNREGTPVLIDFGAARHANTVNSLTIMTTQGYSSPEQALGLESIGPWSDLYSLGATFYTLFTGNPPERGEVRMNEDTAPPLHTIKELTLVYSPHFLKSIDKALEPHVKNRYQSSQEWLNDLRIIPGSNQSTIRLSYYDKKQLPDLSPPHSTKTARETTSLPSGKKYLLRISVAVLLFMIFSGVLLSVTDFGKESLLVIKIKENLLSLEKEVHAKNITPESFDAIQIPEVGIPLDSPSKLELINNFQLRLTGSAMSSSGLPSPLPSSVQISAIYMMETSDDITPDEKATAPPAREASLVIKDSEGHIVATSSNQIPISNIPGQSTICFTFPNLPKLNSSKTYTCYFINLNEGSNEEIRLSCLLFSLAPESSRKYPICRIICAPASSKLITPKTKEERYIFNTLSGGEGDSPEAITAIPSSKSNNEFILEMAEKGYPLAQFKISKIDTLHPNKENLTKGIIWLYKSAIGGYPTAQKELGELLMGSHTKFPEVPDMPLIARKNYAQAARFLRMTFQHHDPHSLFLLGMIYGQGWGVPKSPPTAILFYNKATKLNPSVHTKYLSNDNTILAYWSDRELFPNTPLRIKCEIPLEQIHRMKAIRLVGTGGLSEAVASNIRLTWNNKIIKSIPSPQPVIPGSNPDLIPLSIPTTITPSSAAPVYLEMEIVTEGTNSGVIELETQKTIDSKQ